MIPIIPNKMAAEDHFNIVYKIIIDRMDVIVAQKSIRKNKKTWDLTPKTIRFIELAKKTSLLRRLISCDAGSLLKLVVHLHKKWPEVLDKAENDFNIIQSIFYNYAYKDLPKRAFIDRIGFHTCAYCNRNYIYTISKKREIKPEIDHFYPSAIYPLLAVCYYNLIPACQPCNGFNGKGKLDPYKEKVTNPYLLKNGDFMFSFDIKSISIINPVSGKTSVDVTIPKLIKENSDMFNLEDLYSLHKDHAIELIIKHRMKYSEKYRKYLRNYKGIYQLNDIEIDRLILGNFSSVKDIHKRPLSKLYQDIARELKLIK